MWNPRLGLAIGCAVAALQAASAGAKKDEEQKPPAVEIPKQPCACPGCPEAGLKCCARCQVTFYCGAACQKKHWPEHRKPCKVRADFSFPPNL